MADIKFEIKQEFGVLSESAKGWRKELNLVSWNGAEPNRFLTISILRPVVWPELASFVKPASHR